MTSVVTMVTSPSEPADANPTSLILSPSEQSDPTASSMPTGLTPNHEKMYKCDGFGKCRSPDPVGETLMNTEEEQAQVCEEVEERKAKVRELEQELLTSEALLKDRQGQGIAKENLDIIRDHIQSLNERLVRELEQELLNAEALLKDWRLSFAKDKIPTIRDHIQRLNERLQKAKKNLELAEQSKIAEELQLESKKTGIERLATKRTKLQRDIAKEFSKRPQSPAVIDLTTPDKVLQCDPDKEKEAENELHVRNLIAQVVSCRQSLNSHHFVNDQLYNEFELVVDELKEELIDLKKGWKTAKYQLGETLTFTEGMSVNLIVEAFHDCYKARTLIEIPYFIVSDFRCGAIVVKWKGDINEELKIKNLKYFKKDVEEDGSPKNRCVQCFTDMGPNNPRQLCGKTNCDDDLREARNIQAVKHTTEKQREVKRQLDTSERTEEEYEIKRKTNIDTEKRIKTFSSHDVNRKTVVVPK